MAEELPQEVPYGMLAWEKMGGSIPTLVIARAGKKAWARSLNHYSAAEVFDMLERDAMPDGTPISSYIMVDCDGDALCVEYETRGRPKAVSRFTERIRTERDVDHFVYRSGNGGRLVPTALTTPTGGHLGVAYSNRQSMVESLKWKRMVKPEGRVTVPKKFLTLWSRRRGIWPKGLKVPDDNDGPLPDVLGMSSGNFLETRDMFYSPKEKALLIIANVPRGHGFCHEEYLTPRGEARAYKSCFNRWLVLDEDTEETEEVEE